MFSESVPHLSGAAWKNMETGCTYVEVWEQVQVRLCSFILNLERFLQKLDKKLKNPFGLKPPPWSPVEYTDITIGTCCGVALPDTYHFLQELV